MIDDKKIAEAARNYCNTRYPAELDAPFIVEGFRQGANWANNEFLKSLWHPASDEPRKGTMCLIQMKLVNGHSSLECTTAIYIGERKWTNIYIPDDADMKIIRWLYIDDLLPKKEDEHD